VTDFKASEEYQRGHTGERIVAAFLQRRGWYVIPSYNFSGEDGNIAPRLFGLRDSFIVPDLDIAKGGLRIWVEVKTKSAATFTRLTGRLEHGIDKRHCDQYLKIQIITGDPVYLAIVELDTKALLLSSLTELMPSARINIMHQRGQEKQMVYWPRSAFREYQYAARPGTHFSA